MNRKTLGLVTPPGSNRFSQPWFFGAVIPTVFQTNGVGPDLN